MTWTAYSFVSPARDLVCRPTNIEVLEQIPLRKIAGSVLFDRYRPRDGVFARRGKSRGFRHPVGIGKGPRGR